VIGRRWRGVDVKSQSTSGETAEHVTGSDNDGGAGVDEDNEVVAPRVTTPPSPWQQQTPRSPPNPHPARLTISRLS